MRPSEPFGLNIILFGLLGSKDSITKPSLHFRQYNSNFVSVIQFFDPRGTDLCSIYMPGKWFRHVHGHGRVSFLLYKTSADMFSGFKDLIYSSDVAVLISLYQY